MAGEKEIQENVIKMRSIESQVSTLHQQIQNFERAMIEVATSINALKEIQKLGKDNQSLIPIGAGVFIDAVMKKQDKVLIDVGSGAIVEKTIDEAIEVLTQREINIRNNIMGTENIVQNLETQYLEAGVKVQELRK